MYYRLSIGNEWCCGGLGSRSAQDGSSERDVKVNKVTRRSDLAELDWKRLVVDNMNKCCKSEC